MGKSRELPSNWSGELTTEQGATCPSRCNVLKGGCGANPSENGNRGKARELSLSSGALR